MSQQEHIILAEKSKDTQTHTGPGDGEIWEMERLGGSTKEAKKHII